MKNSPNTLSVLPRHGSPGSSILQRGGDGSGAVREAVGPDLGAGEVQDVVPVEPRHAVVVHVHQLVGQHTRHLVLAGALVGV